MARRATKPLVLVTGASGFLGTRIVADLARDHTVVAIDRDPPQGKSRAKAFYRCDLTKDAAVRTTLKKVKAAHGSHVAGVVHLAAYYDFSGEPSPLYDALTVEGTRRLLRALRDFEVEQFLFSSTLLVMKPAEKRGEVLTEESPTRTDWAYPESKLKAEAVIAEEHEAMPYVVLRIAGVYADDCRSIPLAQQIARIHKKELESYFFPGNPKRGQPFLHVDDLVRCVRAALRARKRLDVREVFLVAEPEIVPYTELQDRLGRLLHGKAWPTIRIPAPLAKASAWVKDKLTEDPKATFIKPWMIDLADAHYPTSIARAKTRLKWSPRHRLARTLPRMVAALKKDPAHWYEAHHLPVPEDLAKSERTAT